jgi:hypothetical protein
MQKFCRIVAKMTCCLTVVCLQTQHISAQTQQKVAREQSDFGADSNLDRAVPVRKTAVDPRCKEALMSYLMSCLKPRRST